MSFRRTIRKVGKVVGVAAAVYFGAPYLIAGAGTVISGAAGALGPAIAGRALGGGGRPPPEQQASGGQQFFFGGGGFGSTGGNVGYSDIGTGGAGASILPGGPFDAAPSGGISPGLLLGIAGGGLVLTILTLLIRR